ncbi:MAG: hypothetical protein BGO14_01145 [Chlamydiales bacterium 38-26]|nr:hypothetical protein [Chlamydiales bacterium]OJV07326.1 MAG: hypothetical protein BGO14_01145 [Chlamydiales bacterium 38-26]
MSVQNVYRNYNNGAYELKKVIKTDDEGHREIEVVNRSIFGPIPRQELLSIIRSNMHPENADWHQEISNILQQKHFYTRTIITSSGREVGMRVSSYIKSGKFAWNAFKTTCYLGVGAAIFFTPSIISSRLFKGSKSISHDENDKKITFSEFIKNHTSYSSQAWWNIMNSDISGNAIVDGLIGVGVGISIVWAGYKLYSQLMKTIGPLGFEEWKKSKKIIFDNEKTVPEQFENDRFWHDGDGERSYICPITQQPIRVPCRTPDGRLFEESAIVSWLMTQLNQGRPTTHPLTRAHLNFAQLRFEQDLSDLIELRILFLEAFPESIQNVPQ